MKVKKYAAIDIGSNAVRLMIAKVSIKKRIETFKKIELIRLPIRLGADVFSDGYISKKNYNRMIQAMSAFSNIMKVHNVLHFKAMATSAMRNAENKNSLIESIKKETGINIEIIDGKKEAEIIFSTKLSEFIGKKKSYIYIDVGGGSTELTIFSKGKIIGSKSFKIGAIRILNNNVDDGVLDNMKHWIGENTKNIPTIEAIGTGGNINKIFKMSGKEVGDSLSISFLSAKLNFLKSFTFDGRVNEVGLNEDRADVIIPATHIYIEVMKWANAEKIYAPKIGLVDGIIRNIYNENKKSIITK